MDDRAAEEIAYHINNGVSEFWLAAELMWDELQAGESPTDTVYGITRFGARISPYSVVRYAQLWADYGVKMSPPLSRDDIAIVREVLDVIIRERRRSAHSYPVPEHTRMTTELTARELAILRLLGKGMSRSEIAAELYVSINTVKSHLYTLYQKLGVSGWREAVYRAKYLGLI